MNRINKLKPVNYGFTLIEVMVALLVLALGILAISKLQGTLIRNSTDANKRSVAASLAQKKIDDLKSFATLRNDVDNDGNADLWTSAATWPLSQQSYQFIDNDEGGIIPPGSYSFGGFDFQLNWEVTPYFYNEGVSNPSSTAAATVLSEFKKVDVTVSWLDEEGVSTPVVLSTVIDAYAAINSGNDEVSNYGGGSPIIPYKPKLAPDVIPVSLETDEGLKKETAKPLPDVSKKGDSISVQFESVTYNTTLDTVKREDFKTVSCLCTQTSASPVSSYIQGKTVWDPEVLKLADIAVDATHATATQKTRVDNSGGELQDIDCDVCCRDSPDVVNPAYYLSPPYSLSSNQGFKACRLKRINGIYRLYKPWKMIAFNLIPASYFDASAAVSTILTMNSGIAQNNIDTYSSYVTSLVRDRAALSEADFIASGVNSGFKPDDFEGTDGQLHRTFVQGDANNRQLQARAVYMDYPPPGIYSDCASCASATIPAEVVPLDRIPFVEVNLTELAGWRPDRNNTLPATVSYTLNHDDLDNNCNPSISAPARNYVTNDQIENGCETDVSRGMFYPVSVAASEAVNTIIYTSNDGVVDRQVEVSPDTTGSSIELKVNAP